jgi:hypothetical protein
MEIAMWAVIETVRRWLFGTDPSARLALALGAFNELADELNNIQQEATKQVVDTYKEINQLNLKVDTLNATYSRAGKARDNLLKLVGE